MDKNQATGIVLIFGILFVYFTFLAPKPADLPKSKKPGTSLKSAAPAPSAAQLAKQTISGIGISDSAAQVDTIPVVVENDVLKIAINPVGARIEQVELKQYKTFEGKPLHLISNGNSQSVLQVGADGNQLKINQLPFTCSDRNVQIVKDTARVVFTCHLPGDKAIIQTYSIPSKGYTIGYRLSFRNISPSATASLFWSLDAHQLEKDIAQNRTTSCVNYYLAEDGFNNLSETTLTEEKTDLTKPVNWISFKQKFFNAGIIASSPFTKATVRQKTEEADSLSVKKMEASIEIGLQNQAIAYQYFFGPNQFKLLKSVAPDYDKNVYLGWPVINLVNRFITVNVFDWLQGVVHNYGVIIIILVLLIKLLLLPLSYKSYISMAKMKVLKPELDAIKERTGDDMQKAQAEQMKLYQQVGINPISGCIPLLLQMPILLAMFNFFPNAIELRQESFLWAPDLSSYDSIATLPFSLPGYGNHVSLFTILMTISTLVLTWYNNQTSTVAGPMQSMSYIMPVVFMFILNSLPAGLSFYYLVSNVVSIVQQQVIKRFVDESKLREKLEANKVKNANKKKTGFAARLEEAMRQAQEAQRDKDKGKKGK